MKGILIEPGKAPVVTALPDTLQGIEAMLGCDCMQEVLPRTPAVLLFSPIILKLGMERGLDESAALWAVVLGSVGSAAGRLLMPLLSDKIGRRPTDLILFGVSLGLSAAFLFARGWAVVAVYAGLTFCYSALAAVLPALSTDLFGLPHAGVNYGFLALGQSVGSLLFPCIADLWGFEQGRHILAIAGAAAGFACIWAVTPVRREPQKNRIEKLRSCAEKRKWKKDCEKFVRNDLQIGPTSSIIKLCVVVPGEALKRERHGPVNARRQGREASAARHQFVKRRV